jgi:hypothetical protein
MHYDLRRLSDGDSLGATTERPGVSWERHISK